jgi:hypothetical protein
MGDSVTVTWTGGDELSGLDHYSLALKVGDGDYQVINDNLSTSTTLYTFDVVPNQLYVLSLTAYDKAGYEYNQKSVVYTDGYEWPYNYLLFPLHFGD